MPLQDATPPTPPPAALVLRSESRFRAASLKDTPLVLTKAGRIENALVRYQLYFQTQVQAVAPDRSPPVCTWTLSSYLQRQLCFTSMTGLFACTDRTLADQSDKQTGRVILPTPDDVSGCGLSNAAVLDAEAKMSESLSATAQARFDADLKLNVTPMLVHAGATVKKGR